MPNADESRYTQPATIRSSLGRLRATRTRECVGVQALVPDRAVKRFDERVVGGLAGTREVECDPLLVGPLVKGSTRELTLVIGLHALRDAMTSSELYRDGHDLLALDALIGVDR